MGSCAGLPVTSVHGAPPPRRWLQQPCICGVSGRKTQVVLEDKLRRLEEECKQKEAERVNLELELTEVTESLKKALAGGVTLGLAIEPRSGTSSPQVRSAPPQWTHHRGSALDIRVPGRVPSASLRGRMVGTQAPFPSLLQTADQRHGL